MQIEDRSLEHNTNATTPSWTAPLAMLVAWLARVFAQIANLKRVRSSTRFKPNWRDHWASLRQCEWLRDQTLAAGAAQVLAGRNLDLSDFIPSTEPPANYGGPCPRTPFEMNRRFLALARFNANPEAAIRAHAARISGLRLAARSTSPALRAMEESNTARDGLARRSAAKAAGGSRSSRGPPSPPNYVKRPTPPACASGIAPACAR